MAKAFANNLMSQPDIQLAVSSPSLPKGQPQANLLTHHDNTQVIDNADVVVLAVKPFKVNDILGEIGQLLPENAVLLSMAAGIRLSHLEHFCRKGQSIVRSMPNTPIAVGKGVTALVGNAWLKVEQRLMIERIFSPGGYAFWIDDEQLLNPVTALSGSGPAYVFLFIEALIRGAEKLGLSKDLAKKMAAQTILGAIELLDRSQSSPEVLRQNVTSAGGTTAAALDVLQKGGFMQLIEEALHKACERAKELGETYSTF
ncbi:pyrroline-5-carboxylate reductase [Legionella birminghamensis]|uniref:Pyrroline-5-carboxylate reductase n=2 Tax=Legionella birminghamensis TaxID=28083 RepID=A0A378ICW5_9GAMM|nr:pyrroline-5-carboxylate reductase [Legionella birminghamensis]STX32401.1 pyrroline-5-carboxylate reductase [Legionella birminghamensis]